jgi:hypothetical protein
MSLGGLADVAGWVGRRQVVNTNQAEEKRLVVRRAWAHSFITDAVLF